jgi:hypothetical protein
MKSKISVLFALICINVYTQANETSTIKINVRSSKDHEPLIGANIYWQNTNIGIISDFNGEGELDKSSIKLPAFLIVTYVGYVQDSIKIGEKDTSVMIHLKEENVLSGVEIKTKKLSNYVSTLETMKMEKITYTEFKKAACCNLSESFQTNASIDVGYTDAVSGAKEIKLLGLSGLYVQNLIEVIPFMRRYSYAFALDQMPSPWIQSISISKGIPSVKNSYEGIPGSLSLELKNAFNQPNKIYFDLFGNSDGRIEANLLIHHKIKEHLATSLAFNGAFRPLMMDRNDDGFLDMPKIKQYNFMQQWDLHRPDKNVEGKYFIKVMSENRISGQNDVNWKDNDPNVYAVKINTKRAEAFAKTGFMLKKNDASIGTQFSGVYHHEDALFGNTDYKAQQGTFTGNLLYQTNIKSEAHLFVTGGGIILDFLKETYNTNTNQYKQIIPGLFAEYTFKHKDRITIIGGMRLDYPTFAKIQANPRVHARFVLDKKSNTVLRVAAGRGFRIPNALNENQSLMASSRTLTIREKLDLENAWNYGISLQQKFKLLNKDQSLSIDVFRTDFQNQTIVDIDNADGIATFYNLDGKSNATSVLTELNLELLKNFTLKMAYKWENVRITYHQTTLQKPLQIMHRGLFAASYTIPNQKLQFDVIVPVFGKSRLPNSFAGDAGNRYTQKYALLNLQMLAMFKKAEFFIGCENVTNFKQKNPIIGTPTGTNFDTYQVWAPISGYSLYSGFRIFM